MSIPLHDPAWLERMHKQTGRAGSLDYMGLPCSAGLQDAPQVRANRPVRWTWSTAPRLARPWMPSRDTPLARGAGARAGFHPRRLLAPRSDKSDHSFVAPPLSPRGGYWWWSSTMRCAQAPLNTRLPTPHWGRQNGGRTGKHCVATTSGSIGAEAPPPHLRSRSIPPVGDWPPGCRRSVWPLVASGFAWTG